MSQQYTKHDALWTTVAPSDLSALDIGTVGVSDFRPGLWWGRDDEIFKQEYENDLAYLAWLTMNDQKSFPMTQPIVQWRVGRPADMWSTNDKAIAATDTYIELVDNLVVRTGFMLHFVDYGVEYRVIDTDDDYSKGWVNGNGDACTLKVERLAGPAVAVAKGRVANAGVPLMGELGTPSRGTTTTPGDPVFNYMSLVGIYGSISILQLQSEMVDGWGTHTKLMEDITYQHRLRKQFQMLFGHRYTGDDPQGAQGQLYMSAGAVDQIETNVLNAGSLGVNLTWPKLNDFWENLFDSELSGSTKDHFCGAGQFRDIRKTAVDAEMLGIQSGETNKLSIGANSMVVTLESGRTVKVHELKKAFAATNLTDWGITLDQSNMGMGGYKGMSEVLVENIENPAQAITKWSDALYDSWTLCIKDESTCGMIRGGTRGLVTR